MEPTILAVVQGGGASKRNAAVMQYKDVDLLEIVGRNAVTLIQNHQADGIPVSPALNADGGANRGIFGRIIQEVEERLLEEYWIEFQHGQILDEVNLDPMLR
jgi:hypothetical protein